MKKLITVFLLVCSVSAHSQYALRLMQYRPTGDLGGVMKKSFGGELIYITDHNDMEGDIRSRFGLGYVKMSPRLDTFPFVSIESSGSQTTVYPGFLIYNKFDFTYLFAGIDYIRSSDSKLKIYPGIDFLIGGFGYDLEKSTYHMHLGESAGYGAAGLRFRGGVLYELHDKLNLHVEINRSYYYVDEVGFWNANDIGFTFQYIL